MLVKRLFKKILSEEKGLDGPEAYYVQDVIMVVIIAFIIYLSLFSSGILGAIIAIPAWIGLIIGLIAYWRHGAAKETRFYESEKAKRVDKERAVKHGEKSGGGKP